MSNKTFGMDEMAALAGGAVEEMAAFRPAASGPSRTKKKLPNEQPDISTMSAAETAALLQEKNTSKLVGQQLGRHRTTRVLAHHALAEELSQEFPVAQRQEERKLRKASRPTSDESEDDETDEVFINESREATRRRKAAPQIIAKRSNEESRRQRRRPLADDSSFSSNDSVDSRKQSRRRRGGRRDGNDSSSSSSSDEEADQRRERLRASRKRQDPEVVLPMAPPAPSKESINSKLEESSRPIPTVASQEEKTTQAPPTKKPLRKPDSSSSSDSDGSSSSGSGSSSSDDSSDEDDEPMIAKPLFVPKHKRNLVREEEKKWEDEERRLEKEKQLAEKRKMESRTMVAKTVAAVQEESLLDEMEDEGAGALNAPPNDDDEIEPEQAQDAWEVRELRRLLDAMDEMKKREKERVELERRRQMTDEEVLEYDKKVGRYQAPGSNRQAQTGKFMQRFYHRGAFYMDKDEFDKDDVRHKAEEYARAATGEDKIDKSALPEVMQVKGFGLARQNTKYKGLAKEDTSDRRQDLLPLVHKKA